MPIRKFVMRHFSSLSLEPFDQVRPEFTSCVYARHAGRSAAAPISYDLDSAKPYDINSAANTELTQWRAAAQRDRIYVPADDVRPVIPVDLDS